MPQVAAGREIWWARWSIWVSVSAILSIFVVGNAFYQKKQFYPTVVYITKSKPSMAVMYAQGLLFVIIMGKLFRKLFFGQLRAAEFEHLVERSWYAVTETCLAFTVFRDDFSPKFLALFTLLLFLKSFHWLAEERVDYMERSPVITWVFHVRVLSLLSLLAVLDVYFVNVAYQSTITKGASVQLVFGFEYAILTTIILNTMAKYLFHVIDMQNEAPWENKAVFVLHTEVFIGLIKVILYILFVIIMVRIYTLPLFALRPTYLALRSFKKALNDVIMSRRAINNMNNLYPDVTAEELAATDNVCIICREEMTGVGAKKLPCNHIFHVSCLRSWFQRQQTCPTCRLNVLRVPPPVNVVPPGARNFAGFEQFGLNQEQLLRAAAGAQGIPPQQPFDMGAFGARWRQQQNVAQGAPNPQQAPANGAQGQGQNAQQPGGTGAPAAPGSSQTGNPAAQGNGNQQPFTMPGFGFPNMPNPTNPSQQPTYPFNLPPMPFIPLVPPPPPLLNVTGLSEEELRRLEGTTREHIEARLEALRNVQILLDSAVVQMQQYSGIIERLNRRTIPQADVASQPAQGQPASEPAPGSSGTQVNQVKTEVSTSPTASGNTSTATTADSTTNATAATASATAATSSTSATSNEQEEIRRRRLQRFEAELL